MSELASTDMPIDDEFLKRLVCPTTRSPLRYASSDELAQIRASVEAGSARTVGGATVTEPLDEGLVAVGADGAGSDADGSDAAGTVVYPIRDQVPVLLSEEAVRLDAGRESSGGAGSGS